jgi:LacI family transcriptional regulator
VHGGMLAMMRLLESNGSPTAILASNDLTAIGVMRAVRRADLVVPRDISIIGFDDIELAEFMEPPLTTVRLSRRELAEHAFQALLSLGLHSDARRKPELTVETHLIVRETTCPACSQH